MSESWEFLLFLEEGLIMITGGGGRKPHPIPGVFRLLVFDFIVNFTSDNQTLYYLVLDGKQKVGS